MSDPAHAQSSAKSRLQFERIAGYGIAANVIAAGPIGMLSDHLAARVVTLSPSIAILAGVLGAAMSASWFRGHLDEKLNSGGQQ